MPRVKLIRNKEDIAPEHYPLFDELAALRGRISGPSTIVLHSPVLAKPWNEISEYLHGVSIVPDQYAELAVSVAAREYDCAYVWNAHVPKARKAGVSEATFAAVARGGALDGLPPQEVAIVNYVRQLVRGNRIDGAVFDPLLAAHGPQWMVELTVWLARYSALSFILNTFEVLPAAGAEPLPELPRDAAAPRARARPLAAAPRLAPILAREQVDAAAHADFDAVARGRSGVRGPFSMLMYSPVLCRRAFDVNTCLREQTRLEPRTRELATIAAAREFDSPYVWASHAPGARREGVPEAVIALVRANGDTATLAREPANDADIIEFVRQVLRAHRVTQALFDRLHDAHGVQWLVELTALIGHYRVITAVLNAFEVAPAAGAEALLD
jgi:4-carboxymuconolactone decarboxylase